jgi:hypothetical protein
VKSRIRTAGAEAAEDVEGMYVVKDRVIVHR